MKYLSILISLFAILALADNNQTTNIINPIPAKIIVRDNIDNETNDTNVSNWNIMDWKKYVEGQNGNSIRMDNNLPTNAQAIMGNSKQSGVAYSGNLNNLNTEALKKNDYFADDQSINNGLDDETKQELLNKSLSNEYVSIVDVPDTIQCFITRDLSFRWQCPIDGIIYGGDMQSNGRSARLKCEDSCFNQYTCQNVEVNSIGATIDYNNFSCNFTENANGCTFMHNLSEEKTIKNIQIDIDENSTKNFLISVIAQNNEGVNTSIINNLNGVLLDNNTSFSTNTLAKEIIFILKPTTDNNATVSIGGIHLKEKNFGKWICPQLQGLDVYADNNFSNKCSSGNIKTVTSVNGTTYTICNDGTLGSDNNDGTFSTNESCSAICRTGVKCIPNTSTITTATLANSFREGCIEGQGNCNNENQDCTAARIRGDIITDETVFDATSTGIKTVQNSAPVEGTHRPRINKIQSGNNQNDFENIHKEEWKDAAFENMVNNSTYAISNIAIGDDSKASSGYRKGITSGVNYGVANTSAIHSLSWNLKPKALDVNNGQKYYLYAVIKAEIYYFAYNEEAKLVKKAKEIWYIKQANSNELKAIKFGDDMGVWIAKVSSDENTTSENNATALKFYFVKNEDATVDYKTFNPIIKSWNAYDDTVAIAPSFTRMSFDENTLPYWNIPIINNIGTIVLNMQGFVRKRDISPLGDTLYYDVPLSQTGDGLLNYSIFVGYSINPLTYETLFEKINNGDFPNIYKMGNEDFYRNEPKDDAQDNENVKIYQYGPADKTTIYVHIKTNPKDVGKKGFIYVFFQ